MPRSIPVEDTVLYKELSKYFFQGHNVLNQLKSVYQHPHTRFFGLGFGENNVDSAFRWDETPQGFEVWEKLHVMMFEIYVEGRDFL